jgi:hypothetical protein
MSVEFVILIAMWAIGIISFLIFTPSRHHRKLIFGYLVCKTLIWLSTLFHVKFNLLIFPIREFPKATDLLLTTEYFFYPLMCGFYIIYEPKLNYFIRFLYLSSWISILVIVDVMIEKYTNLIEYIHYDWYWTWLNFFCLFALSNKIYRWFFREKTLFRDDKRVTQ